MPRIKKTGLDYIPVNTDILQSRMVRRLMKREGDAAFSVLMQVYCAIYGGEGYFVQVDELFYDDLAETFYNVEPDKVRAVVEYAVELGVFDARLFEEKRVLTSADIQQQYCFCTKRRNKKLIDDAYNLLPAPDEAATPAEATPGATTPQAMISEALTSEATASGTAMETAGSGIRRTRSVQNAAENTPDAYLDTQSIAQRSTEKQSVAQQTSSDGVPPQTDEGEDADSPSVEEVYREKLRRLSPPADGVKRNFEGLLLNLHQFGISAQHQYAIALKSDFGRIGHPVWPGFCRLRESRGKIRQPGVYLLSLCSKRKASF